MESMEDALGTTNFDYEADGRIDTVQENTPNAPLIDRDYDALSRLIRYRHGFQFGLASGQ